MKSIVVSDEQFEELKKMAGLVKTQNNRITENPIFCVYEERNVPKPEGCGDERGWVADEGMIKDEMAEELAEEWRLENREEDEDGNVIKEDDRDWEDILQEELGYREVSYSVESVRVADGEYYFTEKAAQEHIDANDYHYHKPFVCVESAWRNPEWKLIRDVLLTSTSFNDKVSKE